MNSITITGHIGRDAEVRHFNNGDKVVSFSVADQQGKDKPTIWWRCSLFGKRAESLYKYLSKGQSVTVIGVVTEREYEKDGSTIKAMDIRVSDVALQGGNRDSSQQQHTKSSKPEQHKQTTGFDDMDDDIPF